MGWWHRNNLRLIQNNLREIDAGMDVNKHVETLKKLHCNVLLAGCGGITAFYPTQLEFHYHNPYLKGDFFGELVAQCHQNGIRVMARFDFSKTHISFLDKNPDWYARTLNGDPVLYNDTAVACINGGYQRKYTLKILREALEAYPIDGVFFNAPGFLNWDYSGNYVGICQCNGCKTRFWEQTGEILPTVENLDDPVFRRYELFKKHCVQEVFDGIHDLVRETGRDIALSTYLDEKIDIIRDESNSSVDRPLPFWIYNSTENVAVVRGNYSDKISSNCVINAVDLSYRFMGVSKYLNQLRLYGNIAAGSGLDFCIIGGFEDYPDEDNLTMVEECFAFHERYEPYYGHMRSLAKILLVKPGHNNWLKAQMHEYYGMFKLLKEEHRLFDVVYSEQLTAHLNELDQYEIILLPSIAQINDEHVLKKLESVKAVVVATGCTLHEDPKWLKCIFGVTLDGRLENPRGAYMSAKPTQVFTAFEQRHWVFLDGAFYYMELDEDNTGLLPLVNPARFGPPEKCYGHTVSNHFGVSIRHNRRVFFPWSPGELYYRHGYEDFKQLLLNVLDHVRPFCPAVTTNAHKSVEIFFDEIVPRQYLLQMLNLSGFNGTTVWEPIPMEKILIRLNIPTPKQVRRLGLHGEKALPAKSELVLSLSGLYEAVVIDC